MNIDYYESEVARGRLSCYWQLINNILNDLKTQICYTKLKGTWFHIVIYCILYITSSKNIIIIAEYLFRNTTVYIIFNIRFGVGMRLINQSKR